MGLVGALTTHYGSPGRLPDYWRQFERTIQTAGLQLLSHLEGDALNVALLVPELR